MLSKKSLRRVRNRSGKRQAIRREPNYSKDVLAVDPGIAGTGWALFSGSTKWNTLCPPKQVGVIYAPKRFTTKTRRCQFIADEVRKITAGVIVCEYPAFWDSEGGQMVAKRGDLVTLAFFIGFLAGKLAPVPFIPVEVNVWKGQLSKKNVENRIKRLLTKRVCKTLEIKTHAWDAVGIGLWAKGFF